MMTSSIGDTAHRTELRSRRTELKEKISRLAEEMSTGRTADVNGRLGGDYSYLSDVEQTLIRLDG